MSRNSHQQTATPGRRANGRPVRWAVLVSAVAIVFLSLIWLRQFAPKPAEPAEVLRSELVLEQGRLHRQGETNAFTGRMVEFQEEGALKSRSVISNGLLHGLSEGWSTNGQLQVREHFQAGVSHGLRIKWYDSGAKMSEAAVVDGKLHGTFRRWHENGTLAEEIEMRAGQPDGLSKAYYASGSLKAQASLRNGTLLEQKSWKDGEVSDAAPATAGTR